MSREATLEFLKDFARNIQGQADSHAELGELAMPFCIIFLDDWSQASAPFLKQKGDVAQIIRDIDDSLRRNQIGLIGPGIFHATPENPLWQRIQSFIQDAPPAPVEEKAEIRPAREAPAAHAALTL